MPLPRLLLPLFLLASVALPAAERCVLLIAGPPSHGPRQHEHNAGVQLLQHCLRGVPGLRADVALNGWPADPRMFADVAAIVIYADGGPNHIALAGDHLEQVGAAVRRGAGIGLLHYAVEPTKEKGQAEFLRWVGGAFEVDWSVNPTWVAEFKALPVHPITRGVQPFSLKDEWYFNLRFATGGGRATPILTAVPPATTMRRRDGPHEGNPAVRAQVAAGQPQTMAWAFERPDGGRGFGFTGGHYHDNWAHDDFRRIVLNAIVWLARAEVPAGGVASRVTAEDLARNLDPKGTP